MILAMVSIALNAWGFFVKYRSTVGRLEMELELQNVETRELEYHFTKIKEQLEAELRHTLAAARASQEEKLAIKNAFGNKSSGVRAIPFSALTPVKTLGQGTFGEVKLMRWDVDAAAREHVMKTLSSDRYNNAQEFGRSSITSHNSGAGSSDLAESGAVVAVKLLGSDHLDEVTLKKLVDEIQLTVMCVHPNIVAMFGVSWDTPPYVGIVLEFVDDGDLDNLIQGSNSNCAVPEWTYPLHLLAVDITKGVHYLHTGRPALPIIHRDIKPPNVLIARGFVGKIADLGASRFLQTTADSKNMTQTGTPLYCAPEIVKGEQYNEKCDIYSLGVMFNEMDTLEIPYCDWKRFSFVKVAEGKRPTQVAAESINRTVYPALQELIRQCWESDPKKRPDATAVLAALEGNIKDEMKPELPKPKPSGPEELKDKSKTQKSARRFSAVSSFKVRPR